MRPGVVAKTIEILWHTNDSTKDCDETPGNGRKKRREIASLTCGPRPIQALDCHPSLHRLCTVGDDYTLKVWEVNLNALNIFISDNGHKELEHVCLCVASESLPEVQTVARWSPCGRMIALGSVHGNISVYWLDPTAAALDNNLSERWTQRRRFQGHVSDIYDLVFSPSSLYLLSCSLSGAIAIHDISSCSSTPLTSISEQHRSARAVAWDPWGRFIASFGFNPSLITMTVIPRTENRRLTILAPRQTAKGYHVDRDTMHSLRIAYSPDGMMLAVPYGKHKPCTNSNANSSSLTISTSPVHRCVYIYMRDHTEQPTIRLGLQETLLGPIEGCAWAPGFFEPLEHKEDDIADYCPWGPYKEYRMALAVWTSDVVIVYTTDSCGRYAHFSELHIQPITSVSWSHDARYLLVSSLDCYVSVLYLQKPIGPFHKNLLFVKPPSMTMLLANALNKMQEAAYKFEEELTFMTTSRETNIIAPKRKRNRVDPDATAE